MVYEIVITWSNTPSKQKYYTEPALLLNKKLWDIMVRNKEGLAKENMFKEWCRRVYMHAEAHGGDEDDCYKSLALDLLSNDLTPEQRLDPKYKIRRDRVSGEERIIDKQRSWINHMLRKNLGDYRVAYFIFNNGLPEILDLERGRRAPDKAMIQNMLEELMMCHAYLLQSILDRQEIPTCKSRDGYHPLTTRCGRRKDEKAYRKQSGKWPRAPAYRSKETAARELSTTCLLQSNQS